MNPLVTTNSSLFLTLNQLIPYCNRLSNALIGDNVNQRDRILHEQTLWSEVKRIRTFKEHSVFSYLIGFYHTIFFQASKNLKQDDLFLYHVLIRLGDLNRYMERIDVAEYYYCNARNLFPFSGHAYNQLGLLTNTSDCYKCCYYYARAAKASDRPMINIADSNLRIAVDNYKCEILKQIFDRGASSVRSSEGEEVVATIEPLPKKAFDWFYLMVVALSADNIQPIAKLFLNYLDENFSIRRSTEVYYNNAKKTIIQCDLDSYMMLATLDILLDWMKLSSSGKAQCLALLHELRRIRACIQSAIVSYKLNLSSDMSIGSETLNTNAHSDKSSTNLTSSTLKDSCLTTASSDLSIGRDTQTIFKMPALPHDYILRGFGPLAKIHNELNFEAPTCHESGLIGGRQEASDGWNWDQSLESSQLYTVLLRIRTKMYAFGPILKKRTRNIALESILSNMNPVCE